MQAQRPKSLALRGVAIGTIALIAAVALLLYFNDPAEQGFLPCAFYQTTGFYCAGCGTARAVHHLLHGHFGAALASNALSLLVLPPVLGLLIAGLFGKRLPGQRTLALCGAVIIALALVFTVLRNIPLPQFDILRP